MKESDREKIIDYFSTTWLQRDRSLEKYRYSGWALLNLIDQTETVLDVGCGDNPFRNYLNVFGIDPANQRADQIIAIEDFFSKEQFDVALCLGSINFGFESDIRQQIQCVVSQLTPNGRIYWRCNPGLHDHGNKEFDNITVFPWSFDHHRVFAAEFGFSLEALEWDTGERIYAEWRRRP